MLEMAFIVKDIEMLIECIEKRPPLYDKSLREYSDANIKKRLWEEVCSESVPGWVDYDVENKRKIGAELQNKWQNLRTCFSRELKAQKTQSGQAAVKRRKYIYFEKLLFLKPSMSQRHTESNLSDNDEEGRMEFKEQPIRSAKQPKRNKTTKENFQEKLLSVLKEDLDEDKNFALSLVPALKSLTEDEKYQTKIQFLQILRRVKANRIFPTQESFLNKSAQPSGPTVESGSFLGSSNFYGIQRSCPSSQHYQDSFQTCSNNFIPSPEIDILD